MDNAKLFDVDNVNQILCKILTENEQLPESMRPVFERYIEDNNPSVVLNDYISKLETILDSMRRVYYRNASNRNFAVAEFLDLMAELERETTLAKEKLKLTGPEDVNEDNGEQQLILKADSSLQTGIENLDLKGTKVRQVGNEFDISLSPKHIKAIGEQDKPPVLQISHPKISHAVMYFTIKDQDSEWARLVPFKNQMNAERIYIDLQNPNKFDSAMKRLAVNLPS